MISYAQNFEDVMLARAFRTRETGFYIDIGAMDPSHDSVTKHFYDLGWSGINVEPDHRFYEKLVAERPRDVNLELAVGDAEEERIMYMFETSGISTFNPTARDRFAEAGHSHQEAIRQTTTLARICEQYCQGPIDFLKVDVEGWEEQVLSGADWAKFRPIMAVIESIEPCTYAPSWHGWEPGLLQAGYTHVYDDGVNRFYLSDDHLALQESFRLPPNIFDGFVPAAVVEARLERDLAQAKVEELSDKLDRAMGRATAAQLTTEQRGTSAKKSPSAAKSTQRRTKATRPRTRKS